MEWPQDMKVKQQQQQQQQLPEHYIPLPSQVSIMQETLSTCKNLMVE